MDALQSLNEDDSTAVWIVISRKPLFIVANESTV